MSLSRYILPVLLFSAILLTSCGDSDHSKNQTSIKEAIQTDNSLSPDNQLSENLQKVFKSDMGVFRGVEFYTPMSEVKRQEDTTQVVEIDEEEDYINYTVNLNTVESVDILYYFDKEEKVVKMEANVYPESQNSQSQLFNEFMTYFTTKYGEPVNQKDNQLIWKEDSIIVVLSKTGNDKIHDLKIEFQPAGTDAISTL